MKITYNGKTVDLHWSYRVHMMFENATGYSIDKIKTANDVNILFYCVFVSTLQYNKIENSLSYFDFMNWVDDNGNDKLFIEFNEWFLKTMTQKDELAKEPDAEDKEADLDPNA